jgi:hypothetical protein
MGTPAGQRGRRGGRRCTASIQSYTEASETERKPAPGTRLLWPRERGGHPGDGADGMQVAQRTQRSGRTWRGQGGRCAHDDSASRAARTPVAMAIPSRAWVSIARWWARIFPPPGRWRHHPALLVHRPQGGVGDDPCLRDRVGLLVEEPSRNHFSRGPG